MYLFRLLMIIQRAQSMAELFIVTQLSLDEVVVKLNDVGIERSLY